MLACRGPAGPGMHAMHGPMNGPAGPFVGFGTALHRPLQSLEPKHLWIGATAFGGPGLLLLLLALDTCSRRLCHTALVNSLHLFD